MFLHKAYIGAVNTSRAVHIAKNTDCVIFAAEFRLHTAAKITCRFTAVWFQYG